MVLLLSSFSSHSKVRINWFELLLSSCWDGFSVLRCWRCSCCRFISNWLLLIPEIEDLISRSSVFCFGSSAAVSKRNLTAACWILLLERAPRGLAQQLYLEKSKHGKYDVTLDTWKWKSDLLRIWKLWELPTSFCDTFSFIPLPLCSLSISFVVNILWSPWRLDVSAV